MSGPPTIRVMVADDHAVVRHGLQQLLGTAPDMEIVATAVDGRQAVELAGEHRPDVVLMDLAMPVMGGAEATRLIGAEHPDVRVLVLTSFGDETRIIEALDAGARGYLLKHTEPDALIEAVRAVHYGEVPLDPRAGQVLLDRRGPAPAADLSQREREVLELVAQGLANKQVVKAHLTSVFQRIGVTDRVQAALWAREHMG
jgi:DNA-binding NarL/FixJ family response regulator